MMAANHGRRMGMSQASSMGAAPRFPWMRALGAAALALLALWVMWRDTAAGRGNLYTTAIIPGLALFLIPLFVLSPLAGLGIAGSGSAGGAARWTLAALLPAALFAALVYTQARAL